MKKLILSSLIGLLATVQSSPTLALGCGSMDIKDATSAFSLMLAQEESYTVLHKDFPSLRPELDRFKKQWRERFGDSVKNIEAYFKKCGVPEGEVEEFKVTTLKNIRGLDIDIKNVPIERIKAYLGVLLSRSEGKFDQDERSADIGRFLLALKYQDSLQAEYDGGDFKKFTADGSEKSAGMKFSLDIPKSWVEWNGWGPHTVRTWSHTSGKTGLEHIKVLVKVKGPKEAPVTIEKLKQFSEEPSSWDVIREGFPDDLKVVPIKIEAITIDNLPALRFVVRTEGKGGQGTNPYTYQDAYAIHGKDHLLTVIFTAGAEQEKEVNAKIIEELAPIVLNSLKVDAANR